MSKIIVADTGPLIALALLQFLPTLPKLFSGIYVPEGVISELLLDPTKPGAVEIINASDNGWLTRREVQMSEIYIDLIEYLDQGEAEALALAKELKAVALIDERRGRIVAARHGIVVTGSAAVLIKAKKAGMITSVAPLLEKLRDHGYRLSPSLIRDVLRMCGEDQNKEPL